MKAVKFKITSYSLTVSAFRSRFIEKNMGASPQYPNIKIPKL